MKKIKVFILKKLAIIKKFNYKQYAKTNILFFTTVISLLINATLLRSITLGNFWEIKPILGDLAIIVFMLCPVYLIKPSKQIRYLMVVSVIMTAICIINNAYYTYYASFASVSLLATSLQALNVPDAVTEDVAQLKDLIYIWQPLLLLFLHVSLKNKRYYAIVEKVEIGKERFLGTIAAACIIFFVFCVSLSSVEIGRFIKQWNREFIVMKFGIYAYQLNDIVSSLEPKISAVFGYDNAAREVRTYYDEHSEEAIVNQYTDMYKGKNLIMIHAESIQNFTLGLSFNGVEVTPNLNKLAGEGFYFSNFYSQVGVGTSSDTEFTLSTSLMPSTSGTVFVSYWNREYVTIPKLLKAQNYYAFSMHGNKADMWNRQAMHKEMGYEKFYSKVDYDIDDVIGLGLSDKSFFRQSIEKIKAISEKYTNYYGTLIMLSNHTPFTDVEDYGEYDVSMKVTMVNAAGVSEEVTVPYLEGTDLGNYLKSVHYADAAIGEFIAGMDTAGLLDNTVILIYGDHDARIAKSEFVRLYNYDPYTDSVKDEDDPTYVDVDYYAYELNRKVPLIIWTKDKQVHTKTTEVMGMYDILPTVGNMFGFKSEYALGKDIFSTKNNSVVFSNGNWLTDDVYYNSQKEEFKLLNDTAVVSQDYIDFYTKDAEEKIAVSNDIILYDYIRKSKVTQKILDSEDK